MSLKLVPIGLRAANEAILRWHRHHKKTRGHKFSLAIERDGVLCGVAVVGRPVARNNDDGWTLEVTRVATDGTPNACSMLYGAARRVAREMGYRRIITYTLDYEPGISLRAAGWRFVRQTDGGSWSRPSRGREDKHPITPKRLWEAA